MEIAYVGNFAVSFSTETHIAKAWENLGHTVHRIPEQGCDWARLPELCDGADLFLWTRTAGFDPLDVNVQHEALQQLTIPKVGYHLDRWWGLDRETWIHESPFFSSTDFLCTADGGHQDQWAAEGITHYWFPPAILSDEAKPGNYNPKYQAMVGFVGNLVGYGHKEWAPYRFQLADVLRRKYGSGFRVFPGPWKRQIRGRDLADLYATVPVLVGDSCLVGTPCCYWSDRIPETTGRRGFLIHPRVEGLDQHHPDLATYELGDFEGLLAQIERGLYDTEYHETVTRINYEHTLANHTYEHRMNALCDLV